MKIVYLDQNHWIDLAKSAQGRESRAGVSDALVAARQAADAGVACFPLSFTHLMELHKHRTARRRMALAQFMLELSDNMTTADLPAVVRHEAHLALSHAIPHRLAPPGPLAYLDRGLSHAAGRPFGFSLEWPSAAAAIPAATRKTFEAQVLALANLYLFGGTLPSGESSPALPPSDLRPDRRFQASLAEWRGAAQRYPPTELKRRIYAVTFADMKDVFGEVLRKHDVPVSDFLSLGEAGWCELLDCMPSRRVDMHLRYQWAKNPQLKPRVSDLNDWTSLGIAASYCDVVVTEKQTADLMNRGLSTRATVVASLGDLPPLLLA